MTRIACRTCNQPYLDSRRALFAVVVAGFAIGSPAPAQAARLSRFLTSQDLDGRMVLDQNGDQVPRPTAGDRHPAVAKGTVPTYLAIPLDGGEHLPASIPILETGSQSGESPVGPLNFDTIVKTNLDTTLTTSRLAVVDTPSQNYLVEYLPRRAKATTLASRAANEVSNLLNTGTTAFNKVTDGGLGELEKFLHIRSKSSTTAPSLNLEAQVLSPVPEPSTWMVFSTLIGVVAAMRLRAGRAYSRQ